ncbi:hypothetical protein FSB78_15110 [Sphingomonas ginsenosidivorax]|uniref:Uncharacterized protein n=1 Tax=Sphingomonas ginsenosidivorax TaxID=862135 RepID=A0A5C6UJA8_9SPHN|nr:hypothetical protein [Sphingomonas ginsenosidivorax]TXC72125.1 hypothetical protein FSB78_15110 [Sphingomonas ginsenosidivorax]
MRAVHRGDTEAIAAAIADVQDLTHQIESGVDAIDDLIRRRIAAISRMLVAADRHVVLADPRDVNSLVAKSEPTPPFLPELVALAVHEAGNDGATVPFIAGRLRTRLGLKVDTSLIVTALQALIGQGDILDRGTRYFAPNSDLARGTRDGSPTIKSLIVEAMEMGPGDGMAVAKIRDVITERHGRQIPLTTLHPIVRQLERAGRVVKVGHKRALRDRTKGLAGD